MPDRIVLCVDDEPIILLALRHQLRARLGDRLRCETATSAEAALEHIASLRAEGHEIHAVVSDWFMPGMKGDAFLRKVHAEGLAQRLVLLTGYADSEMILALEAEIGLAATFQKPCDTLLLVEALMSERRAQR
jgi:CheY-like chemotaxis protein